VVVTQTRRLYETSRMLRPSQGLSELGILQYFRTAVKAKSDW